MSARESFSPSKQAFYHVESNVRRPPIFLEVHLFHVERLRRVEVKIYVHPNHAYVGWGACFTVQRCLSHRLIPSRFLREYEGLLETKPKYHFSVASWLATSVHLAYNINRLSAAVHTTRAKHHAKTSFPTNVHIYDFRLVHTYPPPATSISQK
jgi:hypothetical protein